MIEVFDHPNLCRVSNGQFELIVAPALGRIVRYGPVNGPNMLWENPQATETPSPFVGWKNWGGDKVWIWPEDDWSKWQNGLVAPPGDPSIEPYEVDLKKLQLRMISPVIPAYGVRIVRHIAMEATGSRVVIANRVEKIADGKLSLPIAAWTVTQIPAHPQIFARLLPFAKSPRHEGFAKSPWQKVREVGDAVILDRQPTPWMKIGLEADLLSVPMGNTLFTAEANWPAEPTGTFEPCRRAQVFSDPDDSPFRLPGVPPYIELEFTSRPQFLSVGQSTSFTLMWELQQLASSG